MLFLALALAVAVRPTECDRLAAYGADRDRIAPGVARSAMDLAQATTACRKAVADNPRDPRLNYQLSRLLGYAHDEPGAARARGVALAAGYPIARFVAAHEVAFGPGGDRCRGAAMMRDAARAPTAFAAQVGFVAYVLDGSFAGCPGLTDAAELKRFVAAARPKAESHFETLLLDSFARELARDPLPHPEPAK